MGQINNQLVEIVYDSAKKKLRAKPVNGDGWIRFPRALRIEVAQYIVAELRQGKSGSWIACGDINSVANELKLVA